MSSKTASPDLPVHPPFRLKTSGSIEKCSRQHVGAAKKVEVINAGVNAWSYAQMHTHFRNYELKYEPDIVVLAAMSKLSILKEFWSFLRVRKKFRLIPIVFFLLLLGAILVIGQGSALAPFIYSFF